MINLQIGSRIRRLRLEQHRTQQDIAAACGVSKSLISKIESNGVVPPVATLVKIAAALGTNVSSLIEETPDAFTIVARRGDVAENMIRTEQGYWIHPYATHRTRKLMQPFLFLVRKGEVKEHHLSHEGEEFIYVLEGRIRVEVGLEEYVLEEGDALYFDAAYVHQVIPETEEARYLDIFV
jgi:transcriptional regulator with XRE-family HTH domain